MDWMGEMEFEDDFLPKKLAEILLTIQTYQGISLCDSLSLALFQSQKSSSLTLEFSSISAWTYQSESQHSCLQVEQDAALPTSLKSVQEGQSLL